MKEHKFLSRFWTGETGKQIREAGRDAQVLAAYLITCPGANSIGLFYIAFPTILHEVGIEQRDALAAMQKLANIGFAYFDAPTEIVWIPEMAKFQLGESLKPSDKKVIGVRNQLSEYRTSKFHDLFFDRYAVPFHLGEKPAMPEKRDGMLFDVGEPKRPPVTPEEVVDYWNASGAKQKATLTDSRKEKIRLRLKDPNWPWREAIDKLPIPNRPGFEFQPNFTYLIKNDRIAYEIAEGKFDRNASDSRQSSSITEGETVGWG